MEQAQPTAGQENPEPIPFAAPIGAPVSANVEVPGTPGGGDPPANAHLQREPRWGRLVKWVLGLQVVILLALAQVMWAGYRLGVGNQTIQIPFLKRSINSELYKGDAMVEQTLPYYSSYF